MRANPTPTRRAVPLAALGAAAALLVTGCGADASAAPDAWSHARGQLEHAQSLRMVTELRGHAARDAQDASTPDSTDVAGPVDGTSYTYAGVFRDGPHTTRQENMLVDGQAYQRYTVEERGGVAGDEPAYAEKWTASPATVDPAHVGMGAMVTSLLNALPAADGLQGQRVHADPIRRSGQDAVRYTLDAPMGAPGAGFAMTGFTVSRATGDLLTVETLSSGTPAVITFSDWDGVPAPEKPAASDVAAPQQDATQVPLG